MPERLDYATTEEEVRDAVIDFNKEIARIAFKRGAFGHMTPLLNPDDVMREWRGRRRGDA